MAIVAIAGMITTTVTATAAIITMTTTTMAGCTFRLASSDSRKRQDFHGGSAAHRTALLLC
jgi:hypothetical protein